MEAQAGSSYPAAAAAAAAGKQQIIAKFYQGRIEKEGMQPSITPVG